MNKIQKNKLSMFGRVDSYLIEKEPEYTSNQELKNFADELKTKYDEISNKEDERNNSTKGTSPAKSSAKDSVIESTVAIAGALFTFAKKNNDLVLMEKTNLTRSKLKVKRDVELSIILKSIKDLVQLNIASLAGYGIDAAKLAAFEQRINKFEQAKDELETSGSKKSGTIVSLSQLFIQADDIINSIDKLMEGFRETNLEFYSGYKTARTIKDIGTRQTKIEEPEVNQPK